ncbi:hypothetical protein DPEC_G00137540 [Dallia pectoralis]|uniref:Uncharacterized protein n=1 Tax=Dallia pectoralis TaxID=75939 RepID=A0ACC2GLE7_DALPE|nr:hypothetical protein DPEC_G00137540 [Dallia pectoralis]
MCHPTGCNNVSTPPPLRPCVAGQSSLHGAILRDPRDVSDLYPQPAARRSCPWLIYCLLVKERQRARQAVQQTTYNAACLGVLKDHRTSRDCD